MAEIILFHHVLGLTPGITAFADDLRAAGHTVHTPDSFEGRTFDTLEDGIAYARQIGFDTAMQRGVESASALPAEVVYMGFSLGVMPAQQLAQTRPGAKGAVLMHAAVPLGEFGDEWPAGVPLQIHTMQDDDMGDVAEATDLAAAVDGAELFLYPGDQHLFTDRSIAAYDEAAAKLVMERILGFLQAI